MTFIALLFLSAFAVSACAAWFSVAGLISIFSSAPLAIGLMGGSLELAKLVAASWLYRNWQTAPRILRYYFAVAVVVLSIITSLGIFGYLSKAHLDQSVITGQAGAGLVIIDEKIRTQRENIEAARTALAQMDAQVNERLSRSTDDRGAERAVQIRRQQQPERQRLQQDIAQAQTAIAQLTEQREPLAAEVRKVEAKVGPIKYIAELIYGASDQNLIDSAVRVVIISLIFVFDPLAILMVIAGNMSLLQYHAQRRQHARAEPVAQQQPQPAEPVETTPAVFEYEQVTDQVDAEEVRLHKKDVHHIPPEILDRVFNKAQGPRPEHPHARKPE